MRKEIAYSREVMEAQLRAYIGRNTVLEDDAFYHNIFPIDNVVQSALKWIEQNEQSVEVKADIASDADKKSEN